MFGKMKRVKRNGQPKLTGLVEVPQWETEDWEQKANEPEDDSGEIQMPASPSVSSSFHVRAAFSTSSPHIPARAAVF